VAVRADTHALSRPVPYLLERAYTSVGSTGQVIEAPIRRTSDGALVDVTQAGSSVTITGPSAAAVVTAAAVVVTGGVAAYTWAAGEPAATYSLGDGWTVTWSLVIDGEIYTIRHPAILCEYVPYNIITAADLYGGSGIAELRYKVPQAQKAVASGGDGTGWGPQIDAAYFEFIRRMLADGRPIWKSREPTGYWSWLLAQALYNATHAITAPEGSPWAVYRKDAYHRLQRAEDGLRLQYDTEEASIRRPGDGPIYTSPVGRPRW
jgi:hypothetical protein